MYCVTGIHTIQDISSTVPDSLDITKFNICTVTGISDISSTVPEVLPEST